LISLAGLNDSVSNGRLRWREQGLALIQERRNPISPHKRAYRHENSRIVGCSEPDLVGGTGLVGLVAGGFGKLNVSGKRARECLL